MCFQDFTSRGGGCAPYNARMRQDWTTKLIHSDVRVPGGFRSLATPVSRGSTTSGSSQPVWFETSKMMLAPVRLWVMSQTRLCYNQYGSRKDSYVCFTGAICSSSRRRE